MPTSLIVYVIVVLACDLALTGWEVASTRPRVSDLVLFGAMSVSAADARIRVTVSIGVAVLGQHGHDLFELLAAADVALYKAKDAGRDQVRVYAHAQGQIAATAAQEEADEATDGCP
jgi:diguanylate cyclase (GGDEF)-like protein